MEPEKNRTQRNTLKKSPLSSRHLQQPCHPQPRNHRTVPSHLKQTPQCTHQPPPSPLASLDHLRYFHHYAPAPLLLIQSPQHAIPPSLLSSHHTSQPTRAATPNPQNRSRNVKLRSIFTTYNTTTPTHDLSISQTTGGISTQHNPPFPFQPHSTFHDDNLLSSPQHPTLPSIHHTPYSHP